MTSNNFQIESLKNITNTSNEELKNYESQIQQEFKDIVKQYIEARLLRINQVVDNLDEQIKEFEENDKQWDTIYKFETEAIETMKFNQESINAKNTGFKNYNDYEREIIEIVKNISHPNSFDEYLNSKELEFNQFFQPSLQSFDKDITTVYNESQYQTKLINNNIEKYKNIIWLQYRDALINKKNQLINENLAKLHQLNNFYHNEKSTKYYISDWDHYHKSLISTNDLKNDKNVFGNDQFDPTNFINTSIKANRYEITNIKQDILNHLPSNKQVKCNGLNDEEIDYDLNLMKGKTIPHHVDVIIPESQENLEFQQQYNDLLSVTNDQPKLPTIPPIKSFNPNV